MKYLPKTSLEFGRFIQLEAAKNNLTVQVFNEAVKSESVYICLKNKNGKLLSIRISSHGEKHFGWEKSNIQIILNRPNCMTPNQIIEKLKEFAKDNEISNPI